MNRRIGLNFDTQHGAQHHDTACSTHQHWKHLLRIHIPDIVNYDGAEHTVTKLLTQRDTSSENKAGWTVGLDSWLTVGRKGRDVGNNTTDVFRDGAVMDALIPYVFGTAFITEVMQQNGNVKLWFCSFKVKLMKELYHNVVN